MGQLRRMTLALGLCLVSAVAAAQTPGRTSTNDANGSGARTRDKAQLGAGIDTPPATTGTAALPVNNGAPIDSSATASRAPAAPRVSARDRTFFDDAARGGMAEVTLGGLAKERAQRDEVKQFAQRMIDDHSKAGEELNQIGAKLNLTAPRELPRQHRAMMDKLGRLSGAAFDKQYMQHMLEDHKKDVAAFRKQADMGTDGALKSFALNKLPTLESHLAQAQEVYSKVK